MARPIPQRLRIRQQHVAAASDGRDRISPSTGGRHEGGIDDFDDDRQRIGRDAEVLQHVDADGRGPDAPAPDATVRRDDRRAEGDQPVQDFAGSHWSMSSTAP